MDTQRAQVQHRSSVVLEAVGLCRAYGSVRALEGLTFSIGEGEVVGFLGPNGAGKTTAIRVLTTILRPTAGRFSVAGIGGDRPDLIRGRIGVLPESSGYPDVQTGEEYLRYHARLHGRTRASVKAVARDLLVEVGLGDRGGALVSTYSRGMRQRLGIARCLVNDPALVFLDEPTLGLDPAGQRDVLEMIRRISRERGTTVFVSTHLLGEVEEVCSRVITSQPGAGGGRRAGRGCCGPRCRVPQCSRARSSKRARSGARGVAQHAVGGIRRGGATRNRGDRRYPRFGCGCRRSLGRRPAGTAWRRGSDHRLRTRKRPPE